MSKCLGDFPASLQSPAEGTVGVDWLQALSVHMEGLLGGVKATVMDRWMVSGG